MRQGITVEVNSADRARLQAIVADRNSRQKHVWRARIVLMTADGVGTNTIMRQTGKSKVTVWRWQERFMAQGVDGLLRDKTRPSRIPRLPATVHERTVALTLTDPPGEVTHWTAPMMAEQVGISVSSVKRIWHTLGSNRIACASSSCRAIASLSPSCATLSVFMSIRRRTRWCCRSTKNRKSRRSTAPSPACQ